jgi:hypothetical protein
LTEERTQISKSVGLHSAEIGWNKCKNNFGESLAGDVFSIVRSRGISDANPIKIHNNYIDGNYPTDLSIDFYGSGIMCADSDFDAVLGEYAAFVHGHDNHIIRTSNLGIAAAGGNNIKIYNNRVFNMNLVNGVEVNGRGRAGVAIWDAENQTAAGLPYGNHNAYNNTVGYIRRYDGVSRNDWYIPNDNFNNLNGAGGQPNIHYGSNAVGDVTLSLENAELAVWQAKVTAAGYTIGN